MILNNNSFDTIDVLKYIVVGKKKLIDNINAALTKSGKTRFFA